MCFYQYCIFPCLGDYKSQEFLVWVHDVFVKQFFYMYENISLVFRCFPFNRHLEICLQKESAFWIWSSASNLSVDKDFIVVCPVSGINGAVTYVCGVGPLDECCWVVLLQVLKIGPSGCVADSMLIIVGYDRQSTALLHSSNIHWKVILYVANSSPHLLTLFFTFFPLRNLASGLWLFLTITSVPWR